MFVFSVALDLSWHTAGHPTRLARNNAPLGRPDNAHQPEKEQCHWKQ